MNWIYNEEDLKIINHVQELIELRKSIILANNPWVTRSSRADELYSDKVLVLLQTQLAEFLSTRIPIGISYDPAQVNS